MAALEIPFEFR